MAMQGLYGLWLARNEARDGVRIKNPADVAAKVSGLMDEWAETVTKKTRVVAKPPPEKWMPPETDWVKLNVDGAVSSASGNGGGGVVARDHAGAFRGALAQPFPNCSKPELVELMACRQALVFGRELGIQRVHAEMDCREAVSMVNPATRNLSVAGPIVEDVKTLMRGWVGCKITWRRRTANQAAHTLAKVAVGDGISQVWRHAPPDCILSVIANELPDSA
nr:uncharacterized protein LOC109784596 [Aegilops tauschii subsp. strangulata]